MHMVHNIAVCLSDAYLVFWRDLGPYKWNICEIIGHTFISVELNGLFYLCKYPSAIIEQHFISLNFYLHFYMVLVCHQGLFIMCMNQVSNHQIDIVDKLFVVLPN